MLAGCHLRTVADLRVADLAVRVEKFIWSLTEGQDAVSPPTAADHGKHARQFTRWLWRKRKLLVADPLAGMDLPSQKTVDKQRALTADELARLIASANGSSRPHRGLTGPDHAVLYAFTVTTGFRREESFTSPPRTCVSTTTRRPCSCPANSPRMARTRTSPLSPGVARLLRPFTSARPTGPLFPGSWRDKASGMLYLDLADAGIDRRTTAGKIDFHSLRHTFVTMLGRNAPRKVVQYLARHSTLILTVGRYSHAELSEKAAAVASIRIGEGPDEFTRLQLETLAGILFILANTLFTRTGRDTLPDTQKAEIRGDERAQPEPTKGPKTAKRSKVKH